MMRCILNWFSVRMIASLITTRLQLVVEEEKIHASRGLNERDGSEDSSLFPL